MADLLRTPLYHWHIARHAKMVDFAGWEMPVVYSGIVEEHQSVRTDAGLFDISHMGRLSFIGSGALDLIQRVYTNNAATMKYGQARYGLICNEAGGVRDDVLLYKWPHGYAMVVNAANRTKIVDWLNWHKAVAEVEITDQTLTTCMMAVQGPKAIALIQKLSEVEASGLAYYHAAATRIMGHPGVVSRTGYTGEEGVEFMVAASQGPALWEELVRRGARPCGLGARDTLRLEAAMPLYGHELNEDIDPLQAGLGWAVKFDKGDFIGRDAILRRKDDPTLRRRVGLELAGRRIAREGYGVWAEGKEVGVITSGTFAPTLQKSLAMAYVEPAYSAIGARLDVDIRGKPEPATVVKLPFYSRKNA